MDKRVIIAIVLCIGILAAWSKLFPPASAPPAQQTATAPASPTTPPPAGSTAPPPVAGAAAAPAAGAAAVPAAGAAPAANPAPPEQQVALETPDMRFVLSNRGGTLLHALLLDKKFLDGDPGQPRVPHDLVRTVDPKDAALRTSFPDSSFPTTPDGTWNVSQPSPGEVVFSTDSGSAHIEKRYKVEPTRFRLHLDVVVSNRGDKPLEHHFALAVSGRQDPDKRGGGSSRARRPTRRRCSAA